ATDRSGFFGDAASGYSGKQVSQALYATQPLLLCIHQRGAKCVSAQRLQYLSLAASHMQKTQNDSSRGRKCSQKLFQGRRHQQRLMKGFDASRLVSIALTCQLQRLSQLRATTGYYASHSRSPLPKEKGAIRRGNTPLPIESRREYFFKGGFAILNLSLRSNKHHCARTKSQWCTIRNTVFSWTRTDCLCTFNPQENSFPVKSHRAPHQALFSRPSGAQNYGIRLPYRREGKCLIIRQPSLGSVREYFWNLACSDLVLDGAPEVGPKYLAMMLQQRGQGRLWESQELQKFLGENVVLTHGEPRLGGDFFLRSARFGQFAKIAVRKKTKLIVIVKDHAAVPGHAKIFREQVAGKDIGGSKVFDRLPVIAPGSRDCLRLVFSEKKVERAKTTLDIGVRDDGVAAFHLHNGSGIAQKFGQQLGVEAVCRDAQMLELVRFDQSSRAVMFEN